MSTAADSADGSGTPARRPGGFRRFMRSFFFGLLQLVLVGVCVLTGVFLGDCGFEEVRDMRRLERVPRSATGAPLTGETNMTGSAAAGPNGLLTSPDTRTPCIGYRYLVEREERDSDGNTTWVTVSDVTRINNFLIDDGSGPILVREPTRADVRLPSSNRRRSGNMRYTEFRLHEGHGVFVFGWAELPGLDSAATRGDPGALGAPIIRFDVEGQYRPIVSRYGELQARESMALASVMMSWGSTTLLSLAVFFLFGLFRWHDTRAYVIIVSLVLGSALLHQGYSMVRDDLMDAAERADRLRQTAGLLWQAHGQSDAAELALPPGLSDRARTHLERVRLDVARAASRSLEQRQRFPERFVVPFAGIPEVRQLPVSAEEQVRIDTLEAEWIPARLRSLWAIIFLVAGLIAAFALGLFAIRSVRVKRLIENLPTTPNAGVAFGLVEIGGSAAPCTQATGPVPGGGPGGQMFNGPLSGVRCLWYHYTVKEKRGSGKNSSWVTINDVRTTAPLESMDPTGRIRIYPEGCEYFTHHTSSSGSGNRRYYERRIQPGDPLYVLGTAEIDEETGDRLCIRRGDVADPYIVANLTEREVLLKKARRAQLLLNLGINAFVLAALLGFGISGSFAATDYLLAALVGPFYLAVLHIILMYNDLVFLRERVERNRANIDVALKRRHDLVQAIIPVVEGYARHEASLLERIAQLRTSSRVEETADATKVNAVGPGFRALREAYPNLQANKNYMEFAELLTALENDIALTRSGLNDAVERYNSRRESFPEVLLSTAFRFKRMPLLQFEAAIVNVPRATRTRALTGAITIGGVLPRPEQLEGGSAPAGPPPALVPSSPAVQDSPAAQPAPAESSAPASAPGAPVEVDPSDPSYFGEAAAPASRIVAPPRPSRPSAAGGVPPVEEAVAPAESASSPSPQIVAPPRPSRPSAAGGVAPVEESSGSTETASGGSPQIVAPPRPSRPSAVGGVESAASASEGVATAPSGDAAGPVRPSTARLQIVAPPRPLRAVTEPENPPAEARAVEAMEEAGALRVEVRGEGRQKDTWRRAVIVRGPDSQGRMQVRYEGGGEEWVEGRRMRNAAVGG